MPRYTPEEREWLCRNYPKMPTPMMARLFEERFGRRVSTMAISDFAWARGLSKEYKKAGVKGLPDKAVKAVRWSNEPEKQEWMLEHCTSDARSADVSAAFEERFGFPLSRPQITLWRQANGRATRFARDSGYATSKLKPVGSEYVGKDGYVQVKVADRPSVPGSKDNWKAKHILVWEKANGPVPEGHCVWMADGDKTNFDLDNLVLVPRRLNSTLNNKTLGFKWCNGDTLRACLAAAELHVKARSVEESVPRQCGVCGRMFTPDPWRGECHGVNRQTCRECLNAGMRARGNRCNGETGVCEKCGRTFRKQIGKQRICHDCQPDCVKRRGSK